VKRALLWSLIAAGLAALVVGCKPRTSEAVANGQSPAPVATQPQQTLKVDIPCGLTVPMREAMAEFETANPGVKMEGTYDNAITNALGIKEKGERPDLFISPGKREMEILEEQGLIDETTKAPIGFFELVVVTPKDNPKDVHSLEDITKADVISLPDPDRNSIGAYGKEALQKKGLWNKLMPKGDERIVLTEFPIAAYEMIASGKADAALMFRNCPLQTYPEKLQKGSVVIVADVDKKLYEQPLCFIAMLKDSPNAAVAKKFIAFLAEPETQKLLGDNGLDPLNERAQTLLPEGVRESGVTPEGPAAAETKAATPTAASGGALRAEDLTLPIKVEAYYPNNADHAPIKKMVEGLAKRYPGKVEGEFVDFTSDEGYARWHDQNHMTCGGITINGKQTFLVERKGKMVEATFMMSNTSGEWTDADLYWLLDKATGKQ
jgi:molybdate transport system substrate-binding protein